MSITILRLSRVFIKITKYNFGSVSCRQNYKILIAIFYFQLDYCRIKQTSNINLIKTTGVFADLHNLGPCTYLRRLTVEQCQGFLPHRMHC